MSALNRASVTAAERDAIYRHDFLAFAQAAFARLYPDKRFSAEWFHEAIALELARADRQRTRLIMNAPPRSLKSFLVSIAWPAFVLGHMPTREFFFLSYSQDLANKSSIACRRLMESDFYKRVFPTRLMKTTEDELVTTAGGYRRAGSVCGTVTGLGGDIVVIDDPLNANEAGSETSRKAVNDWFGRALATRLDDKASGSIILVMQRLHEDDLSGHLLALGRWELLKLPAIAPCDTLIRLQNRTFHWREGEPLQKREGLELLEEQKAQMGLQAFNAQYMQDPLPDKGNLLDPCWLKFYDVAPSRQPGDQIIHSWDTALKPGQSNDYSAGLILLVRNTIDYYLIDVVRRRLNFTDLCDVVEAQARKHTPNAILIEEHASGIPLIAELRNKRGISTAIGIRPTKDKRTRMEGETPKLRAGCLVLPKAAPWLDEFMAEYLAFPGGKFDDQMDALSQFLNYRTDVEKQTPFSFDFGFDDPPVGGSDPSTGGGAPSAEDILWWRRKR